MDDKKRLEQERSELNTLINKGVTFEVQDCEVRTERVFLFFRRRRVVPVKRTFKIDEPTLATLDRLSAEWIEFAIDEDAMKSEDGMQRAKTMVREHAERCARIIAIAVLGSGYTVPKPGRNGTVRYVEDRAELNRLTRLFADTVKPSQLLQLCVLINAMSNLGDFMNSIRLMQADRSTMPVRIEENRGV